MAIAKMSKLRLIGLKQDSDKILDYFTKCRQFEAAKAEEIEGTFTVTDEERGGALEAKRARIAFAIDYLLQQNDELTQILKKNEKAVKKGRDKKIVIDYVPYKDKKDRSGIGMDDFYDVGAKEYELMSAVDAIEQISFERLELKAQISKIESDTALYRPYIYCPLRFSQIKDTKTTTLLLASIKAAKIDMNPLAKSFDIVYEMFSEDKGRAVAAVIARLEDRDEVKTRLTEMGGSICEFTRDSTAKDIIATNNNRVEQLLEYDFKKLTDLLSYEKYLFDLKILYDYLNVESEKNEADAGFRKTGYTFVLEGWLPKDTAVAVTEGLEECADTYIAKLCEVEDNDEPPTLMHNKKIVQPFEDVTNMYSPPNYRESDPNIPMGISFFIIFGIMMGDAGYGLLLTLGCFLFLKIKKPANGRFMMLFGICGVSAIIWGIFFNSYFGLSMPFYTAVIDVIGQPIKLLVLSILIGLLHLMLGYILKGIECLKNKKFFDAFCDGLIFVLFILGIIIFATEIFLYAFKTGDLALSTSQMTAGRIFPEGVGKALQTTGLIVLLASVVGIALTAGRASKSIGGKIGGGLYGVYGLINVASDILSYIRIFGLTLASAAIGWAFNMLIGTLMGMLPLGVNYVVAVVLSVVLHLLNLALGILSAYVHNMRLQFLEFYGKFYTGDGRLFSPLGSSMKYVYFA